MRQASSGEKPLKEKAQEEENLKEEVRKALASIPGGDSLDKYFGISSGKPEQPASEAMRAAQLLSALRKGAKDDGEAETLLGQIAEHGKNSRADPEALRALTQTGARRRRVRAPRRFPSLSLNVVHYQ